MSRRGFVNIYLVLIIVILAGTLGYFALTRKQGEVTPQTTTTPVATQISRSPMPTPSVADEVMNWNTYQDKQYGFGIKYPSQWLQSIHGVNLVLSMPDLNKGDGSTISITSLEGYRKEKLEDIYNGISEKKIDFVKDCKSIDFSGTRAFDCPTGSFMGKHGVFFYNKKIPFAIHDNIDNDTSRTIISTFTFIVVSTPTPATNGPYVTGITPSSGPIGTVVEIRGNNLSGFEGDLEVYFQRQDGGEKLLLRDTFGSYPKTGGSLMKILVKEPCQKGEIVYGSYSGKPYQCNYVALIPGIYKVWTEPWLKKSNEVIFTITVK
jgi:hypothetical protein